MAFCRNCGSEITEGTRFRPSCGSSARRAGNAGKGASTVVIEMGKYYGILLLILAFVDIWLSYGVVMIGVSVIVIVGSMCCLNKFYGYRGFTTAALIIALVCLLCGTNFKLKTDLLGKIGIEKMMFVVGATHPEELGEIRKMLPDYFFLVPGVGAQGGDLQAVAKNGLNAECGLLVNSSRGIIYASNGSDFALRAGEKAKELQEQMAVLLKEKEII